MADHLDRLRLVVNVTNETIDQQIEYNEFSLFIFDTNPGLQTFIFVNDIYDRDASLVRREVRDDDLEIGRWIAKDPFQVSWRLSRILS